MKPRVKFAFVMGVLLGLSGCGTYSHLRPADPLDRGQTELVAGIGFNTRPEIVPVVQGSLGMGKALEVGAQFENYSTFGWIRLIPFNTKSHKFALAFTFGGGVATVISGGSLFSTTHRAGFAAITGLTIGKRGRIWEPYLSYRFILLPTIAGSNIHSAKLATRIHFTGFSMGIEAGADVHAAFTVPSFAVYFGL